MRKGETGGYGLCQSALLGSHDSGSRILLTAVCPSVAGGLAQQNVSDLGVRFCGVKYQTGEVAQLALCLPSMDDAWGSIPRIASSRHGPGTDGMAQEPNTYSPSIKETEESS